MKHVDWEGALLELQKIVHDYGPKEMADVLGVSLGSLYKQVNPNYNLEINPQDPENPDEKPRYKLGFKTLFRICQIADDFTPMATMLSPMQRGIYTIPANRGKTDHRTDFLELLVCANKESGEAFRATLSALVDNKVSQDEAFTGIKECDEAITAIANLKAKYRTILNYESHR